MLPLVVFSVVAAACLIASFWFISSDLSLLLVKQGGYWLLLFTFLVFLFSAYKNRNLYLRDPKAFLKNNRLVFGIAAALVGLFFVIQDTWFKITMDEFVLASTSMHMHLEKEVFTTSRAYDVNGVYYLLGGYLDKRPYFFAFVVSLVHDIFGYRSGNVFFVNAVVSFLFLISVFFLGRSFGGNRWGWLAMALMASFPLFGFNVTGGGFELFNLLMILLSCYLGKWWLEKPSDTTLVAFTYSGLLLAQCRYESILFVFPVGLLILYGWWRNRSIRLPWPMFFAPLILVPYVLQNRLLNESEVLWQLEEHQPTPFGLHYLSQNLSSAWKFFGQLGWEQSNSPLLLVLSIVCLALWLVYRFHYSAFYPKEQTAWRLIALMFGATIVFNFLLLMFYYWGQLDDPVATRLGLPLHLVLVVFIVYVLSRKPWDHVTASWSIAICVVFGWCFTVPNLVQAKYTRGAYDARQIRWANEYLNDQAGPLLVLYDSHISALADGISAVPVGHGIERLPELNFHFVNKTFSEVLIVQRQAKPGVAVPDSIAPQQQSALEEYFEMELLKSFDLGPRFSAHIHQVNGIRLTESQRETYHQYLTTLSQDEQNSSSERTAYFSKWLP